jgi:predicted metal-binding membrane protein
VEAARLSHPASLPHGVRLALIGGLLGLAAVAWAGTDLRMGGMDTGPGTELGTFGFFIVVWATMMAAMMFPSVAPTVLMYARIQAGKEAHGGAAAAGGTAALLAGYLLAWSVAGGAAYGVFAVASSISIDAFAWDRGGPWVAGAVIVAAAIYQLTPLKDVCLRHCRSPLDFLLHHWRGGTTGALRMGVEHGVFCIGCCWMLMAALFALGVMSLGWMAFIAALIAIEKLLPWRRVANRGIAVVLAILGLAVAVAPEDVPGLTLPGSPEAAEAMEAMEPGGSMTGMEPE